MRASPAADAVTTAWPSIVATDASRLDMVIVSPGIGLPFASSATACSGRTSPISKIVSTLGSSRIATTGTVGATYTKAVSATLPFVTSIRATPLRRPDTRPPDTSATWPSRLNQVACAFGITFPLSSYASTRSCTALPTALIVSVCGSIWSRTGGDGNGVAATVTTAVADSVLCRPRMSALPLSSPITVPFAVTIAMVGAMLSQNTTPFFSCRPRASRSVALNWMLSPASGIVASAGVTSMNAATSWPSGEIRS